jgi:hypothetical protein
VVVHEVLAAVQVELAQQLSPLPPQFPHAPPEQVPPIEHVELAAVQKPSTQHPPLSQALPAQHT